MKIAALLILLLSPWSAAAQRQDPSDEDAFFSLERASLEEALNVRTSVASRSAMKLRETPGLVTVITRDEIQEQGARDLLDVLKLVPEFDFAMDVQGNLGLGVRGNWGNEGKVLLLWDGQTYNEPLYSTIQFDRFPVDQIEQVEIIRGPGSVIYGGNAELAVINIRTRGARSLNGSSAHAAYGQGDRARARYYGSYAYGKDLGGTEVSAQAFLGQAQRSDGRYSDFYGLSYNMNRQSDLKPRSLNLAAARNGLSARLILDDYHLRDRDQFTAALTTGTGKVEFPSFFAETAYVWPVSDSLRLEPKLNLSRTMAWLEKDEHFTYDKKTERLTGALTAFYAPGARTELMAGGEYYHDGVKVDGITADASKYSNGREKVSYDNHAFFGQGVYHAGPATLTAGARYDRHSQYGASLVPRLAVTAQAGAYNFKALYSKAFRAPSIENIRLATDNALTIKPEKTTVLEAEAGYMATETLYLHGNASFTAIEKPIVYYTDSSGSEFYKNFSQTGTRAFGLGVKYKAAGTRLNADYTTYSAKANRVEAYAVPGRGSYLLGFPRHKVTVSAALPLAAGLSANPSAIYYSRRYGSLGGGAYRAYGEQVTSDLNLLLRDRPVKRLTLSLGVKDIFKSGYRYVQPYYGGFEAHAPLPAASREFFFKAGYEF